MPAAITTMHRASVIWVSSGEPTKARSVSMYANTIIAHIASETPRASRKSCERVKRIKSVAKGSNLVGYRLSYPRGKNADCLLGEDGEHSARKPHGHRKDRQTNSSRKSYLRRFIH